MLNSTTKNRINSCRDILVGKIPDPKGQIDQITNALVYKFMDDQDRMSRELGYEASFFTGEYESYAWSRLFDTKLTNQDRANLYIEGLDRLSRADHLPDLFKQIFKDAYLPFRDANTIVMFLTEINGFDYHHSEELGNAFEYLLSIMGSQGDAGQFRTPRHIIEFLVDVVDPQKSETILDPACGTAGFLVEAFKHITAKGDLGVQDVAKLAESITGVDIDPGMAKIARVNLYLHGFKTPKITENDTLTNEKLWGTKYDVILANPPFMTPKGGIQPHDKFAIRANRAEVLFTDYIAEHLRLHGRAGIIVPEGVIFQSGKAYKELRENMVKNNFLWAVVSLPSGVFQPYSGVKTSILFFDRQLAKKTDKVIFVKVSADGYDLGAQRRPINKNDLPEAFEVLKRYKENIESENVEDISSPLAHLVDKTQIAESGEYSLSGERYKVTGISGQSNWDMVKLGDICKLSQGIQVPIEDQYTTPDGDSCRFVRIVDFTQGTQDIRYIKNVDAKYKITVEDLVMVRYGAAGFVGKGIAGAIANNLMKISVDSTKCDIGYLYHVLNSEKWKEFVKSITLQSSMPALSHKVVNDFTFPLPPLEIQEQIVAELDGYQRIIDGARAVIENYKPMIRIDPEWEIAELGNIASFTQGIQIDLDAQLKEPKDGYIRFWRIIDFTQEIKGDERYIENPRDKSLINKDDIVMVRYGATAGFVGTGKEGALANNLFKIEVDKNTLTNKFTYYFLKDQKTQDFIFQLAGGGAIQALSFGIMKKIKIPLPSLEIQQSIVDRIEEEQRLVDANRRLIEIYEGKIKEKMDEVWGVK